MTMCGPEVFGADPATIRWAIVRGDTSPLRIEFLEDDEETYFDTSGWTYKATVYDSKTDLLDDLEVAPGQGYVDIVAPSSVTGLWGAGYKSIVAELIFDLQVSIDAPDIDMDGPTIWTPVIGTISVIGDVSGSL